ncbi:hypothetical protein RHOFW104R3_25985 [Rhodanobacter denitrificans]|nr:hypothetical protein RHOFW104R3_25985 [Rhodanobacter denitrificans]
MNGGFMKPSTIRMLPLLVAMSLASGNAAKALPPGEADQTTQVSSTTTTQLIVPRGNAEHQSIRDTLNRAMQKSRLGNVGSLDPAALGDFDVVLVRHIRNMQQPMQAWPAPPWGGMSCTPGDTASISTCSGGLQQTWELSCVGGSTGGLWVTTAYKGQYVTSCQKQQ